MSKNFFTYQPIFFQTVTGNKFFLGLNSVFKCLTEIEQVLDEFKVSLLRGLHERCAAAELDVGPGLDQEICHLQEPAAAGQGQGRLLRLLSLRNDVRTWRIREKCYNLVLVSRAVIGKIFFIDSIIDKITYNLVLQFIIKFNGVQILACELIS